MMSYRKNIALALFLVLAMVAAPVMADDSSSSCCGSSSSSGDDSSTECCGCGCCCCVAITLSVTLGVSALLALTGALACIGIDCGHKDGMAAGGDGFQPTPNPDGTDAGADVKAKSCPLGCLIFALVLGISVLVGCCIICCKRGKAGSSEEDFEAVEGEEFTEGEGFIEEATDAA